MTARAIANAKTLAKPPVEADEVKTTTLEEGAAAELALEAAVVVVVGGEELDATGADEVAGGVEEELEDEGPR